MQVGQVFTRRFWRAVSGVRARGVCIDPPSSKNNTLSVVWIFSLSVNIHKCCRCVASIRYWCANLSSQGKETIFRCETTVIRFEKNVESFFRKRNCCSPSRVRFFESEFFWEGERTIHEVGCLFPIRRECWLNSRIENQSKPSSDVAEWKIKFLRIEQRFVLFFKFLFLYITNARKL